MLAAESSTLATALERHLCVRLRGSLRDERKRSCAAFGKLISERQNAVSALNGCFDQRDELNQKSQAKIASKLQECSFDVTTQREGSVTHPNNFMTTWREQDRYQRNDKPWST